MHCQQNIKILGHRTGSTTKKKMENVPLHSMVHKRIGQGKMCQLRSIFSKRVKFLFIWCERHSIVLLAWHKGPHKASRYRAQETQEVNFFTHAQT